ncbi:hypothetical protein Zmor_010345 [Zophobas morio]|uniref:Nucleic-acid-binding protein from transposon X-element n=1 Tax=Zophobas morio TaxID=2755281 RepID=A0AA38IGM5_9CUCU|nr:hypothetical protein Zmor_028442 [Zophobas morio]KAJ3653756.1 hypothetical protein Zmor_012992 [Zophobas morio]KAJ3658616.1 hypothetical protein Zmor_010345 [Zophobas morio]
MSDRTLRSRRPSSSATNTSTKKKPKENQPRTQDTSSNGESNPDLSNSPARNSPTPTESTMTHTSTSAASSAARSAASSSASESSQLQKFKFHLKNIPQNFATQKAFYSLLVVQLNVKKIQTLIVNPNRTALLILNEQPPSNLAQQLKTAVNANNIELIPLNQPRMPRPPSERKPTVFSIVIRSVDLGTNENDVSSELQRLNLNFRQIWRIKSMKTNKFTTLIRVTSSDTITIDTLLSQGITLFGRHHECERSHTSAPTPVQCSRCFQRGHENTSCPNRPICPTCPNTHAPGKCPSTDPQCPFCKGNHPAWSLKCPNYKDFAISEDTPIVPMHIIDPPANFADPTESPEEVSSADPSITHPRQLVAYLTLVLMDLFPLQRQQIQKTIEKTSSSFLNLRTTINPSGNRLHFTFNE